MTKKLTIDGILKHKKITDSQKDKDYYSKIFDAEIEIECKNPEEIIEIFQENESEFRKYLKLIYACCPIFRENELHSAYEGIKEPYEIITKVFGDNYNEVMELGNFLLTKFGFLDEATVKKLKKQ